MRKSIYLITIVIATAGFFVNQSCERNLNKVSNLSSLDNPIASISLGNERMASVEGITKEEIPVKKVDRIRVYKADYQKEGRIGKFNGTDNPSDNVYHINIDTILPGESAWLEYELYGLEDFTSVSRGINDQISFGGLLVKKNQEWNPQKEEIKLSELKKGINIIRFTVPEKANYNYKVKNVRIRVATQNDKTNNDRKLVVNQPTTSYFHKNIGYVRGYVEGRGATKQ